jgi:hypothetical protein
MSRGVKAIILGLFILALSQALWMWTASFWGWIFLFSPGAAYVVRGCIWVVEDDG